MIKLNLMTGKIDTTMQGGEGVSVSMSDDEGGGKKELIMKLLLLALPVVVLFVWEYTNISGLEKAIAGQQTTLNQQTQTMQALKAKAGKADQLKGEIAKLEEKLQIMTDLSKKRLRELKALDYLQNIVPDGLWLDSLDYDGSNLKFSGAALNANELNSFVASLESSQYFQQVILLKSTESKQKKGTVKVFTVSSVLGSVN